ncbi:MAG: 16S rRNA (guanine(527)-N(7))-methyltransferase RsmG [Methylophilaceae bacterium]|nr:16S rRNA (guanine(527)-N(7))-methyltransferase RsmG [Methylophilaceae bacterium]
MTPQQKLAEGLRAMGLEVSSEQQQQLLEYLELLAKWNKVHNLTAVRDIDAMVTMHVMDSLSVLPHLSTARLLDVGSGGGLPGIPLAIVRPCMQVVSLDSSHKKIVFQRQVKAELGLTNFEVVCTRVERYRPDQTFEVVISRAFSDLEEFTRLTHHVLAKNGVWMAMKGVYPYDEIAQLKACEVEVIPLRIPGLEAQRHLVLVRQSR